MYLVVDCYNDIHEVRDYKGLRDLLLVEVIQDVLCNHNCYDDVKNGVEIFEKLIKEETTVIKELENRMWKVIDLLDLQRDLESVKNYFLDNGKYVGNICEAVDNINEVIKND